MRIIFAFAVAVASLPLTQSSAAGQAEPVPGTTLSIERVVAQYARRLTPKGKVVLDPWTRTLWSPNTRVERAERDSASIADLAGVVGALAAQGPLFTCDAHGRECRMAEGVDGVITMSRPVVTGDRAEVIITITTRTATLYYHGLHEYEETVKVVKDGAQWRVVGPTKMRAT